MPERQANVTARGLGAEGTGAAQQRVDEDIAVGGLNMETLDLGRGDPNITAGSLRSEVTGGAFNHQIAARGLQGKIPAGADHPDVTRHRIERDVTPDVLDSHIPGGAVDLDSTGDRLGNFDGNVRPGMTADSDTRPARLGRCPMPAAPERPRDLPDDSIEIDVAGDTGPANSCARVRADLDPVIADIDHELALVVAEVSKRAGCGMADEHVATLGCANGDVPNGIVDAQFDRLVVVNGDTILAPSFGVSGVRHDHSSQGWWIPHSGHKNGGRGATDYSAMI